MFPSETATAANGNATSPHQSGMSEPQISIQSKAMPDSGFAMELLELELSVDGFSADTQGFSAHVAEAASAIGGTLLFELPASGLIAGCERIAVLRVPRDGGGEPMTIFACLEDDGTGIHMETPNEQTADLKNFADAFVDVLRRI